TELTIRATRDEKMRHINSFRQPAAPLLLKMLQKANKTGRFRARSAPSGRIDGPPLGSFLEGHPHRPGGERMAGAAPAPVARSRVTPNHQRGSYFWSKRKFQVRWVPAVWSVGCRGMTEALMSTIEKPTGRKKRGSYAVSARLQRALLLLASGQC